MADAPKISVVIPSYNGAHFLPKSIESVLAQDEVVEEIVVVDDGSTDNTADVVAQYAPRVRYVFQSNKGLAGARNTGIREASSEWVALLDCDDWWMPSKIREQKRAIQQNTVLVYTGILLVNSDGSTSVSRATPPEALWPQLRTKNLITPSTVIIRKDALLKIGGFNESIRACEDWDLWVRLFPYGSFEAVSEPLTAYRVVSGSLSSNPERMLNTFQSILDTTLLNGLSGVQRAIWRRRAISSQLYSAALIAREGRKVRDEFAYMLRSIATWPSPFWRSSRFAASMVSLKRLLFPGSPAPTSTTGNSSPADRP